MRPFTATFLVGLASASGILVLLTGLHATEDFQRLEALGAILWGGERAAVMQARALEKISEGAITTSSVGDFYAASGADSLPDAKTTLRVLRDIDDIAPSLPPVEGAIILIDNDNVALAPASAIDVAVRPEPEVRLHGPTRLTP